jgi:hypothetical protein
LVKAIYKLSIHKKYLMIFTLYTPQDANQVLPEVRRRFNSILSKKNYIITIQEELQQAIDSRSSFERFIKKKQELNVAVSNLYKEIEQLEDMGVMIKSVDDGLIDFPSMRFDEEVWLCWRDGEPEIKFWHSKQEGFMGRKPLTPTGFPNEENDLDDMR